MLSKIIKFYEFEGFRLDVAKREIIAPEESFSINEKTSEVLQLLLQSDGTVVRKSEFFSNIWKSDEIDETNLTQHIYRIRKILGKRHDGTEFIETIPKLGYKFAAAVVEVLEEVESENSLEFVHEPTKDTVLLPIKSFPDSDFELPPNKGAPDSPEILHTHSPPQPSRNPTFTPPQFPVKRLK